MILLVGCNARQQAEYAPVYGSSPIATNLIPRYSFGVPAIRHVRSLWDRYAGLIQALNGSQTGFVLKMESGQTPDRYDAKIRDGVFDFAIVDPYQVLVAETRGYRVIARTGKLDRIRGVIVVRRDSGIHQPRELAGHTITFTNPTAVAATLLNEYGLFESGVDVRKRAMVVYTHSPETSLLDVVLKRADAAAVSFADWEVFRQDHAEPASLLASLWQSDDLSGPAVMALRALPVAHVRTLQAALLDLNSRESGREALRKAGISEFQRGDTASFDDVWEFLQRYQRALGPLPDRMIPR